MDDKINTSNSGGKEAEQLKLFVEKVKKDARLPDKPTSPTDSGFNLYSYSVKKIYYHGGGNGENILDTDEKMERKFTEPSVFELQCNERALIGTGIKATVGPGYELQIRPKSGKAIDQGLTVLNTPGTIDEGYRGEICVILMNASRKTQKIKLGEAIAQMVPVRVELPVVVEQKLTETKRNDGGFGRSDKKLKDDKKNRPIFAPSI